MFNTKEEDIDACKECFIGVMNELEEDYENPFEDFIDLYFDYITREIDQALIQKYSSEEKLINGLGKFVHIMTFLSKKDFLGDAFEKYKRSKDPLYTKQDDLYFEKIRAINISIFVENIANG